MQNLSVGLGGDGFVQLFNVSIMDVMCASVSVQFASRLLRRQSAFASYNTNNILIGNDMAQTDSLGHMPCACSPD